MSEISIQIKTFAELTILELYDLLQLRAEVFVVEQNCVYQDIDGKDQKALHAFSYKTDRMVVYTRIFKAGDYFENPSIGRVVVAKDQRMYGYGYDIMNASINYLEKELQQKSIEISAQQYLIKFYNNLGFAQEGEGYLEDDIPHVRMFR